MSERPIHHICDVPTAQGHGWRMGTVSATSDVLASRTTWVRQRDAFLRGHSDVIICACAWYILNRYPKLSKQKKQDLTYRF